MRVHQFASVGKSALIKAVGITENYINQKLDEKSSGCFSCPYYIEKMKLKEQSEKQQEIIDTFCSKCMHKVYIKEYINEKNRHGYAPSLKSNAIEVFLFLHFCAPNEHGVVVDLHIPSVAKHLHCCDKTVHASLRKLERTGYILYTSAGERGYYNVVLLQYEDYFKSSAQGGQGYVTLPLSILDEMIAVKSLNTLRIYIREYINIDYKKNMEGHDTDTRLIRDLLRYLPRYCKPHHVKDLVQQENNIYDVSLDDREVTFKLNSRFVGKEIKTDLIAENYKKIDLHIQEINKLIHSYNDGALDAAELPGWLEKKPNQEVFTPVILLPNELNDVANLTWQYAYEIVLSGIHYIHMHFWRHEIKNYGALLREVLDHTDTYLLTA